MLNIGHDPFGVKRDEFGDAMRALRESVMPKHKPRGIIGYARCVDCGRSKLLYVTTAEGDRIALDRLEGGPLALDWDGVARKAINGTHAPHSCSREVAKRRKAKAA